MNRDWTKFSIRAYCCGMDELMWFTDRLEAFMKDVCQSLENRQITVFLESFPSSEQEFSADIRQALRRRQIGKGYQEKGATKEILDAVQSLMFRPRLEEN